MPVKFEELARNEFTREWGEGYMETHRHTGPVGFQLLSYSPFKANEYVPFLTVSFNPFITVGRGHFIWRLYGVNGAYLSYGLAATDHEKYTSGGGRMPEFYHDMQEFRVYNMRVDELRDPANVKDIEEMEVSSLVVARDMNEAAEIGSWVVDPETRARIKEYHEAFRDHSGMRNEVKKYAALRQAPFVKSNVPGFGNYTYEGVVFEANSPVKEYRVWNPVTKELEDVPNIFRTFTEGDVEWLRDYMRKKGLRIPDESDSLI